MWMCAGTYDARRKERAFMSAARARARAHTSASAGLPPRDSPGMRILCWLIKLPECVGASPSAVNSAVDLFVVSFLSVLSGEGYVVPSYYKAVHPLATRQSSAWPSELCFAT